MPSPLADNSAIVTLWFVTASAPQSVLASAPRADRGFGRKFLAQLNPAWPITPIGQFSLNRSVPASADEFYVAGYPGITIVQTLMSGVTSLDTIDQRILHAVPATDVYVFVENPDSTLGGFAHIHGGLVKRSFFALTERVFVDEGIPGGFEAPFWAGRMGERSTPLSLPFSPIALVHEAQRAWLGFDPATSPDINVVAFAVDGRPEPRIAAPRGTAGPGATAPAADQSPDTSDYDDYEEHEAPERLVSRRATEGAREVAAGARRLGRALLRNSLDTLSVMKERLRHTDR